MPQLDFSTYPSQFFWLAITFSLLYFVMARIVLPQIREVLQNRQSRIASDLKKAEQLRDEARDAEGDFNTAIADARAKASELVKSARQDAQNIEEARFAELERTFEKQEAEFTNRLDALQKEAGEQLTPVVSEFVVGACKKLAGVVVEEKQVEGAVSKLLKS